MIDSALPDTLCFLNGEYGPLAETKVSVLDRGFIFGDGVYEVVPVYGGRPFRWEDHHARLRRSLAEMRMTLAMSAADLHAVAMKLIAAQVHSSWAPGRFDSKNDARPAPGHAATPGDFLVYFQVTRGVAVRDHVMPPGLTPTVFAMCSVMKPPSEAQRANGVACVTADDFRWKKAHIKSTSLAGAVLSRQMSADAGAAETIMFRDGLLSEAAASNVWIVKDGRVVGTPDDHLVLRGVRYGLIGEICAGAGIPFELRRVTKDEVFAADEVLLSSATKEVLAVTTLDDRKVAGGRPGPVYARLHAGYQQAKAASAAAPRAATTEA